MVSILLLFADVSPDSITGAAALAMFCGVVLMGGHSVIRIPLQLLRRFKARQLGRKSATDILPSQSDHS